VRVPGAIVERGDRISLRTVEPEDAAFVQRMYTNPAIRVPVGTPVTTRHETEAATREEDGPDRFLACLDGEAAGPGPVDPEAVERLGVVDVNDADWRRPELGYWTAPEFQGEGYGREMVALAIECAVRTYDHPAIGAGAYEFNDASRGLLESLGFEEEGRTHRDTFADGEYHDIVNYVLFREDWRS
jgi:RimJ/RimL family protein N-acetyltransferase